jgi:glucokinase
MSATPELVLGIDIGGTKVAAGLVDSAGKIISRHRGPMPAEQDAAAGLCAVFEVAQAALAGRRARAVGICAPGPVDPRAGVILNPPNLSNWHNVPLVAEAEARLGLPARLENDANAAALAEALWGAGRGASSLFYVTVGTGIGTGVVLEGKIYSGARGAAVEGGHVSIDYRGEQCGCGKRGCIETLISGPALARRARQRISAKPGRSSAILGLAGGKIEAVTAESVAKAHRAGDLLAHDLLAETADYAAIWLGNMVDVLDPDAIVVGGGMSEVFAAWFEHIREKLPAWSINPHAREIPLRRAAYGEDSGIAGAAALWHPAT